MNVLMKAKRAMYYLSRQSYLDQGFSATASRPGTGLHTVVLATGLQSCYLTRANHQTYINLISSFTLLSCCPYICAPALSFTHTNALSLSLPPPDAVAGSDTFFNTGVLHVKE